MAPTPQHWAAEWGVLQPAVSILPRSPLGMLLGSTGPGALTLPGRQRPPRMVTLAPGISQGALWPGRARREPQGEPGSPSRSSLLADTRCGWEWAGENLTLLQEEGENPGQQRQGKHWEDSERSFSKVQDEPMHSQTHQYIVYKQKVGNSLNVQ